VPQSAARIPAVDANTRHPPPQHPSAAEPNHQLRPAPTARPPSASAVPDPSPRRRTSAADSSRHPQPDGLAATGFDYPVLLPVTVCRSCGSGLGATAVRTVSTETTHTSVLYSRMYDAGWETCVLARGRYRDGGGGVDSVVGHARSRGADYLVAYDRDGASGARRDRDPRPRGRIAQSARSAPQLQAVGGGCDVAWRAHTGGCGRSGRRAGSRWDQYAPGGYRGAGLAGTGAVLLSQ